MDKLRIFMTKKSKAESTRDSQKTTNIPQTAGQRLKHPTNIPQTPDDWALYRCYLSCQIGREALSGAATLPSGYSRLEYAVFNLLNAVEELSHFHRQKK